MIFKVIFHILLNNTHLRAGSSNNTSSENFAEKTFDFMEIPLYITTIYNPSGTLSNSG